MVDRIISWSLHNRPLVLGLSVLFLAVGGWVAWRMPVDVLPDLTAPTVTILVEGQGMAPTDMEALVTFPIETALNGAAGVRRVRSATAVGIAARPSVREGILVAIAITGDFSTSADAASQALLSEWTRVSETSFGHLLGLA